MVIDTLTLKENFQNDIRECVTKKDWRKILQLSQTYGPEVTSEVLWTFPTEYCLKYQKAIWKSFNITKILSIGCGSGLLEFVLQEAIGTTSSCTIIDKQTYQEFPTILRCENYRS